MSSSHALDMSMNYGERGSSSPPSTSTTAKVSKEAETLIRGSLDDFSHGTSVATCSADIRLSFLRKVYFILAMQLAITSVICAVFMVLPPVRDFVIASNGFISFISIIGSLGCLFALMAKKDSFPINMRLLVVFTVFESFLVGSLCAQYAKAGLGYLVLEAVILTMAIFSGLTLYCFVSKTDFSFLGGALYAGLMALIGASVVNLIFGFTGGKSAGLAILISWGGATLFALFILYDTSLLINHLSPDDYIIAAINLYLDILNLFLYILSILSRSNDN